MVTLEDLLCGFVQQSVQQLLLMAARPIHTQFRREVGAYKTLNRFNTHHHDNMYSADCKISSETEGTDGEHKKVRRNELIEMIIPVAHVR